MAGIGRTLFGLIAVIAVGVPAAAPASAEELDPFTGPLPKVWEDDWGLQLYRPAILAGIEGRCDSLRLFLEGPEQEHETGLPPEVSAGIRLMVRGEMHDRGICMPFDPQAAFAEFAESATKGIWHVLPLIGWKYLHGHGAPADREQAREVFIDYVMHAAAYERWWLSYMASLPDLRGRPMPKELAEGLVWLAKIRADRGRMSAFAREIIEGTARYYDGSLIAGRLMAAYDLLWVTRDPEEWYFLGTKLLDPAFAAALDPEDLPLAASNFIQDAAECLHVPAMLHLAHLYETGTGGVDRFPCRGYAWYKAAGRLGAKIDEHLARFDLQAARCGWEYISEDIEEILSKKMCLADMQ